MLNFLYKRSTSFLSVCNRSDSASYPQGYTEVHSHQSDPLEPGTSEDTCGKLGPHAICVDSLNLPVDLECLD